MFSLNKIYAILSIISISAAMEISPLGLQLATYKFKEDKGSPGFELAITLAVTNG